MIKVASVAGIADYAAGVGTTVTFGEFEKVTAAIAKCNKDEVLKVDDTIYALEVSIAGNVVTVLVFTCATVGGPGNAWTEIADHSNLSALTFTVVAHGE